MPDPNARPRRLLNLSPHPTPEWMTRLGVYDPPPDTASAIKKLFNEALLINFRIGNEQTDVLKLLARQWADLATSVKRENWNDKILIWFHPDSISARDNLPFLRLAHQAMLEKGLEILYPTLDQRFEHAHNAFPALVNRSA